jgi:tRNA (guanine-N7-)-methyltransferase
LLKKIETFGFKNIEILFGDAKEAVPSVPRKISEVFINFPDPWPKKKHRKRRLIKPPFVELLCKSLVPGGRVTVATDMADYAGEMLAYFEAHGSFRNLAGRMNFSNRVEGRLPTKYEKKYLAQGIRIYYLQFEALDSKI